MSNSPQQGMERAPSSALKALSDIYLGERELTVEEMMMTPEERTVYEKERQDIVDKINDLVKKASNVRSVVADSFLQEKHIIEELSLPLEEIIEKYNLGNLDLNKPRDAYKLLSVVSSSSRRV